jgi:hypothetical protein
MYVTILLSVVIVEESELIWVCCRWRVDLKTKTDQHANQQHTQISSDSSTIAADNSTGTYIIHYSIELIAFSAEYTLFDNCNFNLAYRYSLSVSLTLSITV